MGQPVVKAGRGLRPKVLKWCNVWFVAWTGIRMHE
jgi:hypothetical protein